MLLRASVAADGAALLTCDGVIEHPRVRRATSPHAAAFH